MGADAPGEGGESCDAGIARNRLAEIGVVTGIPTAWDPNANNTVNAIVVDGTTVYVGGTFTTVAGEVRGRIAALAAAIAVHAIALLMLLMPMMINA